MQSSATAALTGTDIADEAGLFEESPERFGLGFALTPSGDASSTETSGPWMRTLVFYLGSRSLQPQSR